MRLTDFVKNRDRIYILFIALLFGFFIVLQGRSFENVAVILRDRQSNIFQEIKILKEKNIDLQKEIDSLENTLEGISDQNLALKAVDEEIQKYTKLAGTLPIFGSGVVLTINGNLSTAWMIDVINELFNSGAEAVAVNGIRLNSKTVGFDTLPKGQILINGSILSKPYSFEVIGENSIVAKSLQLSGGILDRLRVAYPDAQFELIEKNVIEMK